MRLLVLGILVLAALGDVAQLFSGSNSLGDLFPAAGHQLFELGFELGAAVAGQISRFFAHDTNLDYTQLVSAGHDRMGVASAMAPAIEPKKELRVRLSVLTEHCWTPEVRM